MAYKDFYDAIKHIKEEEKISYCLGEISITEGRIRLNFKSAFRWLGNKIFNPEVLIKDQKDKQIFKRYKESEERNLKIIKYCYNIIKLYSFKEWIDEERKYWSDPSTFNAIRSFRSIFSTLYRRLPEFREREDAQKLYKIIKFKFEEHCLRVEDGYLPSRYRDNPNYLPDYMINILEEEDLDPKV
jgi:hypothetical protein